MSSAEYSRHWRKTPRGVLQCIWFNANRLRKSLDSSWYNTPFCSREEFYDWALDNNDFNTLYCNWVDSNYSKRLKPSINRIIGPLGFLPTNLEWITMVESKSRGGKARYGGY